MENQIAEIGIHVRQITARLEVLKRENVTGKSMLLNEISAAADEIGELVDDALISSVKG